MEDLSKPYFPKRNDLNNAECLLLGQYGAKGYGIYCLILQEINKSYYAKFNEQVISVLASRVGVSMGIVCEIIKKSLRWGLFDNDKYERFGILTNDEIQLNHFRAVQTRKKVVMSKPLLIESIIPELKKIAKYRSFLEENTMNLDKEEQSKEKQSKGNKTEEKETKKQVLDEEKDIADVGKMAFSQAGKEVIPKANEVMPEATRTDLPKNEEGMPDADISSNSTSIENFKKKYPEKFKGFKTDIPKFVNLDILAEKIEESPQFLKKFNNFNMNWFIKQDNYNKVINNNYKDKTLASNVFLNNVVYDKNIKKIFNQLEIKREIDNTDRSLYYKWVETWKMSNELIDYAIKLSKGKMAPVSFLNKVLENFEAMKVTTVEDAKKLGVYIAGANQKSGFEGRNYSKSQLQEYFDNLEDFEV